MKAIVYTEYGSPDVLELREVDKPVPDDHEVLIKVKAASVNPLDWGYLRGKPLPTRLLTGLRKPKHHILGADIAGRVEAVGKDVRRYRPGDEVLGGHDKFVGGFAEYVCGTEYGLTQKPANVSFDEAAAVPCAGMTALRGLRDTGMIQSDQRVLINGASGGVGTFALQIAKSFGATVTAVCSTRNLEIARSLGADEVIDYTQEDFTRNGQCYDLIASVNGYHPISAYRRSLRPRGTYVLIGGTWAATFQALLLGPLISRTGNKQMSGLEILKKETRRSSLLALRDLLETRKVIPVIDRRYPLDKTGDALKYLGEGHAQGKIVITVERE